VQSNYPLLHTCRESRQFCQREDKEAKDELPFRNGGKLRTDFKCDLFILSELPKDCSLRWLLDSDLGVCELWVALSGKCFNYVRVNVPVTQFRRHCQLYHCEELPTRYREPCIHLPNKCCCKCHTKHDCDKESCPACNGLCRMTASVTLGASRLPTLGVEDRWD